ncbi:hypothetical protein [Priestia megaterium]|uniref:hypothetical protein n=1 Tax=Priestia megaterium TaxID=1404 RepID=UPI002E1B29D6|nr:hypothetical protein [Priestia megaterium]
MELTVVRYPKLITVNEYHVEEFRADLISSYLKICNWSRHSELPSDSDLIDMLEEYYYRAASLNQYSDSEFYRTIEDDDEQDDFFAMAANEYFADFSADVRRMGKSQHLFFHSDDEKKYINIPVTEVW